MADDLKALRCAGNSGEICRVLARIKSNLDDMVLCDQYIGQGLVEALRGLTASKDIDVCSSALNLIRRLVSDNPEVKPKLFKPTGFLRELSKLCSPFENSGKHDKQSHLELHWQAASLIKTFVLSSECIPEVAGIKLIGQIIELCGTFFEGSRHTSCCHSNLEYPPKATSYFHDLAHGRKLIGKVRELLPDVSRKVVEGSEAKDIFGKDASICVLSVDLYDTSTDQDIVIRDELVKEGMAWPQFLSPDTEAKLFIKEKGKNQADVWADVSVASVIDGGHFWAQVGGEIVDKKLREIRLILQKEDQLKFTTAPEIGEAVCCKTMVGGHQDFYRGIVLQVLATEDEIMVEIFAVDYGFKNVVPMNCVTRITPLGRKEPFQVRLCCLTGVQPPLSDVKVLVSAAGALRNLAYQSNACRLQILEKDGVDALLKLIVLPNNDVRKQAIAAILNLGINFKTRARIGFLGGIKLLLDLIKNNSNQDSELLCLALGALRNLMFAAPINRGRVAEADGLLILTHVYFTSVNDEVKHQCLGALKNLVGNSWYLLTGNDGVDVRSVTEDHKMKPFSLSTATIPANLPSTKRRTRRLRPGEVEPQPIEKALPSHVIKSSSNQSSEPLSGQSQDENTDGDTDGEEKLLRPTSSSPHESPSGMKLCPQISSFYIRGQGMPFTEDDTHEFRHSKDAKSLSSAVIARPACAFLNAGKGGTVYLGVKKTGVISGVEISRKDRDRLRVGVDEMLGEFKPAVRYDKYQVIFVPVAKEGSEQSQRKNIEIIPDVFVIEVSFSKCSGTVYTTNNHRCYFRCGNTNSEFSIQDVRKWVIREQETFYNNQIDILRRELSAAKQKLETDGR